MYDGIRQKLRIRKRATATGGTYDYVRSDRVPRGEIWVLRGHSFENETGARGTARCYIETEGYEHWVWEQESPAAATLYWTRDEIVLYEGESLVVRQATCTSGDKLQLLASGYKILMGDS